MAKQQGIVRLTGTVNGINYYYRNGKAVARAAGGGFDGRNIKTSATMVRVRENAGEFGLVSRAKKLVRLGLMPFLIDFKDVTLHGRMMRLFQEIKTLDTVSERGQRKFQKGLDSPAGKKLLLDFAISPKKASALLPGIGSFDAETNAYTISNLSAEHLKLPKGADGMQVCLGILRLDFEAGTYSFVSSAPAFIDGDNPVSSLTLTPAEAPGSYGLQLAVVQVRFYQEVNGTRFLFKELTKQGLEVVGVN